jgi:hypothetical protein
LSRSKSSLAKKQAGRGRGKVARNNTKKQFHQRRLETPGDKDDREDLSDPAIALRQDLSDPAIALRQEKGLHQKTSFRKHADGQGRTYYEAMDGRARGTTLWDLPENGFVVI